MTTDELLAKLPPCIGNRCEHDFYVLSEPEDDIKWLYLHNDGKDWCASYGVQGQFFCMNPTAKEPPYDNAFAYGSTPNEALQGLYNWCLEHSFIKDA